MKTYTLNNLKIIIISLLFTQTAYPRDFTDVELKTIHVNGNIYMLEGIHGFAGGNIGVSIGDDGILIVDDQFSEMNEKIRTALAGLKSGQPRFVLNTHWHGDHTGGNTNFSTNATIIAHHNVRKRLMHEQTNALSTTPARPKQAWPVITFDKSLSLHFNNETIKVLHLPNGHTDGDSIIYFTESNVVHMGDHYFAGMFPFVDIATGGNVLSFADNVKKTIDSVPDDVKIIPGHGPLSNKEELIIYHKMLDDSIQYVKQNVDKGMVLEELLEVGLPENLKPWGSGFIKADNWITFIYQSILMN
jgi:glyoxylase-like metal-dependent hydrolase (beta-lactamase superfamily II)